MTTPAAAALTIYRPLVQKVVGALGALVTHQLAYLIVSTASGFEAAAPGDHGHLSLQWAIVTPLAVGAAGGFVVWQLRQLGFRSLISVRRLAALVVGFFAVQELAEGLLARQSLIDVATNPAVLLGLLLGPLVAWAITRILSGVTELVARLLRPGGVVPTTPPQLMALPVRWSSVARAGSARPRAPPSSLQH